MTIHKVSTRTWNSLKQAKADGPALIPLRGKPVFSERKSSQAFRSLLTALVLNDIKAKCIVFTQSQMGLPLCNSDQTWMQLRSKTPCAEGSREWNTVASSVQVAYHDTKSFQCSPHSSPGKAPRSKISTTSRSPGWAGLPSLSFTAIGPLRWCTHVKSMFFISSAESSSLIWPPVQSIVCITFLALYAMCVILSWKLVSLLGQ